MPIVLKLALNTGGIPSPVEVNGPPVVEPDLLRPACCLILR